MKLTHHSLQFITHKNEKYGYIESAKLALEGGCRWIQLRMKNVPDEEFLIAANEVKQLCRQYNATFILNDRAHLCREIGADGVHLGKSDIHPAEARKLLGYKYIIGATANTFDDIQNHAEAKVDYIGLGPFRFTTTKEKLSPMLGLEGYRHIMEQCLKHGIDIPVVAIGGIRQDDIADILQTGVSGIAFSSLILEVENSVETMQELVKLTNNQMNK